MQYDSTKERIAGLDEQDAKQLNNPEISSSVGSGTLFLRDRDENKSVVFTYKVNSSNRCIRYCTWDYPACLLLGDG